MGHEAEYPDFRIKESTNRYVGHPLVHSEIGRLHRLPAKQGGGSIDARRLQFGCLRSALPLECARGCPEDSAGVGVLDKGHQVQRLPLQFLRDGNGHIFDQWLSRRDPADGGEAPHHADMR